MFISYAGSQATFPIFRALPTVTLMGSKKFSQFYNNLIPNPEVCTAAILTSKTEIMERHGLDVPARVLENTMAQTPRVALKM